ncbi:MAG: hypothetical protein JW748_07345 [Anaerolineales bacterium]|nr:hypothetical protein [Anaerolineales bacterium]
MNNYKLKIDIRHLSTISAVILLVNGISRFVEIPSRGIRLTVWNIQWVIELNGNLLFMLLLALLVVVGTESILRTHPALSGAPEGQRTRGTAIHWILPGITAFGGSAAVNMFPPGPRWWFGLVMVTGLLIFSIVCEYLTIEKKGVRFDLASVGLNILGLTMLAMLLNAIHASQTRLTFALPVIAVGVAAIALRLLDLLESGMSIRKYFASGVGLLVAELALPLFYLPVSSVTFGLVLTLATHTVVGVTQIRPNDPKNKSVLLEYFLIDAVAILVLTVLVRR